MALYFSRCLSCSLSLVLAFCLSSFYVLSLSFHLLFCLLFLSLVFLCLIFVFLSHQVVFWLSRLVSIVFYLLSLSFHRLSYLSRYIFLAPVHANRSRCGPARSSFVDTLFRGQTFFSRIYSSFSHKSLTQLSQTLSNPLFMSLFVSLSVDVSFFPSFSLSRPVRLCGWLPFTCFLFVVLSLSL